MGQITDIKPQKRKGRFNLYLDNQFAFGLDAETLVKSGLKINQNLSEAEIQELIKEDDFIKVYDRVLKFFSYRPRSRKELDNYFRKKEVGGQTQKLVIKKLEVLNYLNDSEFTKWWIEQRQTFRPSGARLLSLELRQKGIPKEIIESELRKTEELDEVRMVRKIIPKKMKTLKNLSRQEQRQKLSAYLCRRGFSWETIKEVLGDIDEIS